MTLKHEDDLDILKIYVENEVARLRHLKLLKLDEICMATTSEMKKYETNSQGQRSRSNVTNFQPRLAFTIGHIPTKLHQFLISSFRDFMRKVRQTDRQTDRRRQKQYLLAAYGWRAGNKIHKMACHLRLTNCELGRRDARDR